MNSVSKPIRTAVGLIVFAVCLNAAVNHLDSVGSTLSYLIGLVSPLILGFVVAFLLSIPVNALEAKLIRPHGTKHLRLQKAIQRPLSILLSIVMIVSVFTFVGFAVVPNLWSSLHTLFDQLSTLVDSLKDTLRPYLANVPEMLAKLEALQIDGAKVENRLIAFFRDDAGQFVGSVVSAAFSVFGQVFSIVMAIVIGISGVCCKERLAYQASELLQACVQPSSAEKVIPFFRKIGRTFSSFISGQVLEAFILGMMVTVSMLILGFPHAMTIGPLVMLMAFIPVVGAWTSAIIGAVLVFAADGMTKAMAFILLIIILQQIEGNLIYPRVMGKRVGLPSLWVLVAITLGKGLLGVWGMLMAVPVFSVVYQLLHDFVVQRKEKRKEMV